MKNNPNRNNHATGNTTKTLSTKFKRELEFKHDTLVAEAFTRMRQFLRSPIPEHGYKAAEFIIKNQKKTMNDLSDDEIQAIETIRRIKRERSEK